MLHRRRELESRIQRPVLPLQGHRHHLEGRLYGPETGEHDGTVRWVQVGKKSGRCPVGGDSGAPVYTFRQSDGYVVAKGIYSGGVGDDPVQSTCVTFFTDFHDVIKAVGKDIYKK
ncbi:hypothetical protein AB0L05_41670 [Nonomuraea pusilla]|uniref:hypothetical protein n=1 Tax=Nonomuraea pusilla TaxID=46177 RepID=UPI003321002D